MRTVRRANDRGYADHGWLKSRHTFSFAGYYDPAHVGFRSLRVINEDRVAEGGGFGRHPHRDMEILSYVVSGRLEHQDSMGNRAVIRPGEVQRMSAGSGVEHAEYNPSAMEPVHFFQIWITPERFGEPASYAQHDFTARLAEGGLVLVASGDGRDESLSLRRDADVYVARTTEARTMTFDVRAGRGVWLQVVKGEVEAAGERLTAGDAFATDEAGALELRTGPGAELILFDLL